MTTKHFLTQKICLFEKKELINPKDCEYDNMLGAWVWETEKTVLVKSDNYSRPKICSKKEDIETGEDLKGE